MIPSCIPPNSSVIVVDSTTFVALWVLLAIASFICWTEWQSIFDPKHKSDPHKRP